MRNLITLLLSTLMSLIILIQIGKDNKNFNDLALGEETKSYYAKNKFGPIHIDSLNKLKDIHFEIKKDIFLILGNSQTHSINQMKYGDVNYVQLLSEKLNKVNTMAVTMPNISIQEMALAFDYITKKRQVKFLLLPVFMDDLREDGIRVDVFFKNLLDENFFITDSSDLIVKKINKELRFAVNSISKSDMAALKETTQEVVEKYLNEKLENYSLTWKNRPQYRGQIMNFLYTTRNTIFNINAQTKRKMIPQRYQDNFNALKFILSQCKIKDISTIVYIPPIRNDVEVPYDLNEYSVFKKQLEELVKSYNYTIFLNLENIVEGKYWGVKGSTNLNGKPELDFMHFQFEGHKQLFFNVLPEINKMIDK